MFFEPGVPNSKTSLGAEIMSDRIVSDLIDIYNQYLTDNEVHPFTIALMGKWGSGKTSILNRVIEKLENSRITNKNKVELNEIEIHASAVLKKHDYVIVRFNPWNVINSEQLMFQFFVRISDALRKEGKYDKLIRLLYQYSELICNLLPTRISSFLTSWLKIFRKTQDSDKNLEVLKTRIEECLRNFSKRILIIIDDIDRLSIKQIQIVFHIIATIANFPKMTYLLSFDRDIVVNALSQIQDSNGSMYIEKLIDIPIILPLPSSDSLCLDLKHELLLFVNEYYATVCSENENRIRQEERKNSALDLFYRDWKRLQEYTVKPFLRTYRDVKRILNGFKERARFILDKVNLMDLLSITILEIQEPLVWTWIKDNQSLFVYQITDYSIDKNNQLVLLNDRIETFTKLVKERSIPVEIFEFSIVQTALIHLFLLDPLDEKSNEGLPYLQLIGQKRIVADYVFPYYFGYNLTELNMRYNKMVSLVNQAEKNHEIPVPKDIAKEFVAYFAPLTFYKSSWAIINNYIQNLLNTYSQNTKYMFALILYFIQDKAHTVADSDFFYHTFHYSKQMHTFLGEYLEKYIENLDHDNFFLCNIILDWNYINPDRGSVIESHSLDLLKIIYRKYDKLLKIKAETAFPKNRHMADLIDILQYAQENNLVDTLNDNTNDQ